MATPTRERRLIDGVWQWQTVDQNGGSGGSLPTNVEWDEDALTVHEASDSGPFTPNLFQLKTLLSGGLQLSVKVAAFFTDAFTTYNENGDPLLESDPLANGGDGEVRISGFPFSPSTPNLAAVIAAGNTADNAIAGVTDPTNAQDAATKASAQAQADAAQQNAEDYADSLSTPWQAGTGIHVLQGATPAVLVNSSDTFYSWAVDANGLVTVNFGALVDVGTATTDIVVVGFPDLPLGSIPTFNRSGALGCLIGGTEYNLFADISSVETEVQIVPAHVPQITDPLIHDDRIAGMFSYPAAA